MPKYRAIVSIIFDEDDLEDMADEMGIDAEDVDIHQAISGDLDSLSIGCPWIEQIFVDREPTIHRLSGGIDIVVSDFEED